MQFMNSEKVAEESSCWILDPPRVTNTNFSVNLDKNLDAYKDLTKKQFNSVLGEKTQMYVL
jgi:hypothetical protein